MQESRFLLNIEFIFGLIFALGGLFYFAASIVMLVIGIKKKKTFMYILSGVSILISLPISALGIYIIYDVVRYLGYMF